MLVNFPTALKAEGSSCEHLDMKDVVCTAGWPSPACLSRRSLMSTNTNTEQNTNTSSKNSRRGRSIWRLNKNHSRRRPGEGVNTAAEHQHRHHMLLPDSHFTSNLLKRLLTENWPRLRLHTSTYLGFFFFLFFFTGMCMRETHSYLPHPGHSYLSADNGGPLVFFSPKRVHRVRLRTRWLTSSSQDETRMRCN